MTRNLYLGADLGPAIAAADLRRDRRGGEIINDVDASDFPARAKLLAKEIAKANPDLLGLQEAALWRYQTPPTSPRPRPTDVRYDFLAAAAERAEGQGRRLRGRRRPARVRPGATRRPDGNDATGAGPSHPRAPTMTAA